MNDRVPVTRRTVLWTLAAATGLSRRVGARQSGRPSLTFVLVHGAWHGGWCWKKVVPILRADGHQVYTPTLTGLGERRHLANPQVTLSTHIQDVAAVLEFEDLRDVVLVGTATRDSLSLAWRPRPEHDFGTSSFLTRSCRRTANACWIT
jgi:pimeloyl-ACP methyl ester carboxylesterase